MRIKPGSFEGLDDPMSYNGGAHFMGLFKVGIPVSGTEKEEKASGRSVTFIVITLVAVLAAFGILAHFLGSYGDVLPFQEDITIGMTQFEVFKSKDVAKLIRKNGGSLEEVSSGVYKIENVKSMRMQFDVYLKFDANNRLCGLEYVSEYTADAKKAAKDIADLTESLNMAAVKVADGTEVLASKSSLREHIGLNSGISVDTYYLAATNIIVNEYLRALEVGEDWPGRVNGYLVRKACCYMDMDINYNTENEQMWMRIAFVAEADRDGLS